MLSIHMPLEFEGKTLEIEGRLKVRELLKKLSLSSEGYLVIVNGNLVAEDGIISEGDNVKIIRVVSGG